MTGEHFRSAPRFDRALAKRNVQDDYGFRWISDDRNAAQSSGRLHPVKEIETLSNAVAVDILLVHDAPAGVRFERHRRGIGWVSEAAGLDKLIANLRPKICFFGHHHTRVDAEVANVRCIGLNKVRKPGNLVAIEFQPRGREWSILGEWPPTQKTAIDRG